MNTPTCPVCTTRPVSEDCEGNRVSYGSYCGHCFWVISAAPYCHHTDHHGKAARRTVLANPGRDVTTANAIYSCPDGHGQADAIGWATGDGTQTAEADVALKVAGDRMGWLVDTRLKPNGIAGGYDAEHPVARAYSRAYVDTARGLLANA